MQEKNPNSWVLQFRFLGIPVRIHPLIWVVLALLGGAIEVDSGAGLLHLLLFIGAGMLALLVHELGHALVGRACGYGVPEVELGALGGMTHFSAGPRNRSSLLLTVLAGPLASLALGALAGLAFGCHIGAPLLGLKLAFLMPWMDVLPLDIQQALVLGLLSHPLPDLLIQGYTLVMVICFWWSVFNLLPIYPMDGGKVLAALLNSYLIPAIVGLVLAAGLAIWSLCDARWFNFMILGYLAFLNYQYLRVLRRH